jgi:membrane protease YdiL (CAAX protease family)
VRSLRGVYREVLEPTFARIGRGDVLAISLAAGVCEELLFRGAIQQEWGLLPASLLFGAAHLGGSGTVGFGIWAGLIGVFLGALAIATHGLLAPIVAHAAYDALALAYIRWKATDLGPAKYLQ